MSRVNVEYINQMPDWPTGCESVSTVMALNSIGVAITVDQFIKDYLPQKGLDGRSGVLTGPDPNAFFIGDPHVKPGSYGCYAPVIVSAVNKLMADRQTGWQAVNATGVSTSQLIEEQIDNGRPVIYWATINFRPSFIDTSWQLEDKTICQWISPEHCLLLIGAEDDYYWCADPYDGNGLITIEKQLLEDRHREMMEMAVVLNPAGPKHD